MLEEQDIQKIRKVVSKVVSQKLLPFSKKVSDKQAKKNGKTDAINVSKHYSDSNILTKEYLADRFARLEGCVIIRRTENDKKVNLLFKILEKENPFKNIDVNKLKGIKVFPIFKN